jgi:glycosylphosphatidylinositol transamidase (GPIT) subunit GPI8
MNEFAFVLGNGQSRLEFDTSDLQSRGTVFACNRMYTDKHVDVLVSVDEGMTKEIQNHKLFCTFKEHYTRPQYTNNMSLPLDKRWQGYSSGPNAAAIAATKGFAYICLIGMDLHSDTSYINMLVSSCVNGVFSISRANHAKALVSLGKQLPA